MNFTVAQVNAISNLGLAHMGVCVAEILCWAYLCAQGEKTVDKLHRDTIHMVKATSQAKFVDQLLPLLTEEEQELYRRGRNAHVHAVPKNATHEQYSKATGLECLFGSLYLLGRRERINNAHFMMIALDENDKPVRVPRLILQTDDEHLAWSHGEERKRIRNQRRKDQLDWS